MNIGEQLARQTGYDTAEAYAIAGNDQKFPPLANLQHQLSNQLPNFTALEPDKQGALIALAVEGWEEYRRCAR